MRLSRPLVALTLSGCASLAFAQPYEVSPEVWDRPRTASSVAAEENVRRAVLSALSQPEAQIVIRHAAAQEQILQAEELRSWLGALAIDPQRIALRGDLAPGAQLRIDVVP